jgi:hypothetical protein
MSNEITAQQSAYALPQYGQPIDWSFIRTKAQYQLFVSDYKKMYAYISQKRRRQKLATSAFSSAFDKPEGTPHLEQLKQKLAALVLDPAPAWLDDALNTAKTKSYAVAPTKNFKCQKGMTTINLRGLDAVTWWILNLRKYSKVIAQNNWVLDHPTTPPAV